MRIVKHAQQCTHNGSILSGYILGLDIDGRLEITETVPLPAKHEHEDSYNDEAHRAEGDRHQKETLESLLAVVRNCVDYCLHVLTRYMCRATSTTIMLEHTM
jgi:hypothetical protein